MMESTLDGVSKPAMVVAPSLTEAHPGGKKAIERKLSPQMVVAKSEITGGPK
jgi:hypothetical protein